MKKPHNKQARRSSNAPQRRHSSSAVLKQSLFALIVVGVISFTVFTGHCVISKSCSMSGWFHDKQIVTTSKGKIAVEVVDTPISREKGLSGKKGLNEGEGMLFVFDKPGRYGFWMKDMLFPIDMAWINEDGLVVHIEKNVKPDSYPTAYINTLDASYVLEIGANESEKFGLYMGAQVTIQE